VGTWKFTYNKEMLTRQSGARPEKELYVFSVCLSEIRPETIKIAVLSKEKTWYPSDSTLYDDRERADGADKLELASIDRKM